MKKIWLSPPHLCGDELNYIKEAFDNNRVAPEGPHSAAFEQELSDYTGRSHTAALSSGTSALHLALRLLGIRKGHYVACQAMTFVASANPILYQRATPVFIDSEAETWNMCPEALETAIRRYPNRIRAVIGVNLYGMPGKLDDLTGLCEKHGIPYIEDAAAALGSVYKGRKAGTFGRYSVLSFNGNKIITTSAGGALLSDSERDMDRARYLAAQANVGKSAYYHVEAGYNYRMSNICAGIGRAQLKVIGARVKKRRKNYEAYYAVLRRYCKIGVQKESAGVVSNRWLSAFTIGNKERKQKSSGLVLAALQEENIEARRIWTPMHAQPVFRKAPFVGGEIAVGLSDHGICLPSGSNLTDNERERVLACVLRCLQRQV